MIKVVKHIKTSWDVEVDVKIHKNPYYTINEPTNKLSIKGTILLLHGILTSCSFFDIKYKNFIGYLVYNNYRVVNTSINHKNLDEIMSHLNSVINKFYDKYEHKLIIIGHSMGGLASMVIAGANEDKVARVVSISAPYGDMCYTLEKSYLKYYGTKIMQPIVNYFDTIKSAKIPIMTTKYFKPFKLISNYMHRLMPIEAYKKNSIDSNVIDYLYDHIFCASHVHLLCDLLDIPESITELLHKFEKSNIQLFIIASKNDKVVDYRDTLLAYEKKKYFKKKLVFDEDGFGHIDLILGRDAIYEVWNPIVEWLDN